jgi:ribosomal protein S18 acetylase RimI-like enzyme
MLTERIAVRAIRPDELPAWLALARDDALDGRMRAAWDDGTGGPDRTFVLERDGVAIGRVGYTAEPLATVLPDVHEATVRGIWVAPGEADPAALGGELLARSIEALRPPVRYVDAYANTVLTPDWEARRGWFEAADLPLFQEKIGFRWTRDGPPGTPLDGPRRLTFRSLPEVGREAYALLMGQAATVGTLDRQDRHYAALCGLAGWGREMLGYATPEEESDWLAAYDPAGTPAGFVALGTFDPPDTGTIVHIGIVPGARGRGYVHELFAELEVRARRRGLAAMLSDVDVLNHPMRAAMERAGHRADATDWHVWHYRREL